MFPWIIFTDYILSYYDLNFVSVCEKCSNSHLPTKYTPEILIRLYTRALSLKVLGRIQREAVYIVDNSGTY